MKRMKEEASVVLLLLTLSLVVCCCYAQTKECTNIPTQSHSFRYELLTSKNETWKKEVMSHFHLTPTDDSAWADLLPRRFLSQRDQHDWAFMYRKIKNLGVFKDSPEAAGFLKEVPLQDVRLPLDSIHGRAQNTNLEYLLMLDVDRLLWSFRKTAGLDTPGTPYGGWEGSNVELRGHFVGHYLSASALMWASTQNDKLKDKMSAVVAGLSACQQKIGTGYLSAFPSEFFDRFEAIQPVWAPYYTIHKILAGLLDQHTFAGNPQALKVVTWMVDYFYNRVLNVITKNTISRHYESLNEETGGMNDVLYRLFTLTADPKHLMLAHLFDKPCFLGLLAVQANDITNFHANTHIPVVIGAQMRHEVTGDPLYKDIGTFFMDIINSSHSYATGGTSVSEFWHNPKRIADNLKTTETEESCTTYNMLKVSRHLFRWTKEVSYADYYERALTNGVLSIQRGTDPGVMIYMLPLARGVSKAKTGHGWGTQFDSFWCCYGTGIESFSKLGDSIYFEEQANEPTLYIIQYISSSFNWKSGEIEINQTVDPVVSWDPYLRVTFTFSPNEKTGSTLKFRIPSWTSLDGAKATLNDATLSLPSPGNFLSVSRQWSAGDKLKLQLPITIRTEAIKDDRPEYASVQAILYGPYLLAGHTTGDWDINSSGKTTSGDWITPVSASYNSQLFTLYQGFANSTYALTNTNQSSLTMESLPTSTPDPDSAIDKTFRLVPKDPSTKFSTWKDLIGKSVTIELFNPPGMYVIHQGPNQPLIIDQSKSAASSSFIVVQGLDGQKETVSLKSESDDGCFVTTDGGVKLSCSGSGDDFNQAASFVIEEGIRKYNPISFVAKGANRDFLLEPLFTFKDLPYTVYFNIQS